MFVPVPLYLMPLLELTSRVCLISLAMSLLSKGFWINRRMPSSEAWISVMCSLYPEHNMIGISGFIFMISCAKRSPDIPGIVMSVIIKSNTSAITENTTNSFDNVEDIEDGFYVWNVTCTDDSGRSNTSETRSFTINGDPTVTQQFPGNMTTHNLNNDNIYLKQHVQDNFDDILK